jgi:hypothetical protein
MPQERPKQLDSPLLPKIFADERARLWPKLVELYADFDNYQSWTDREIPVVVLRPS